MINILQTLKAFRSKWRRALLSSSGVLIATLCLVIINHLSLLFQNSINEQFNSHNGFAVSVTLNLVDTHKTLPDPKEISALKLYSPHIKTIEPVFEHHLMVDNKGFNVYGVSPNYNRVLTSKILRGRQLHKNDRHPYIVLTDKLYNNINNAPLEIDIGSQIILDQSVVEIIGTCTEFEPFIFMFPPKNGAAFVSLNTFKQLFGQSTVHRYILLIDDLQNASKVVDLVEKKLRADYPNLRINIYNPKKMMDISARTQGIFSIFAYALAFICAFLGGIGIMNMSIAEISERRCEIALRIAFGATPRHILRMLCLESTLLCIISAILGITLGLGLFKIISSVMAKPFILSIRCIISSILFACSVGVLSNLYPAKLIQKIPVAYILKGE